MHFLRRAAPQPGPVALFPGAYNPPTSAHLAMARAALDHAAEVVFVLPRAFPHKTYDGPAFRDRLDMLLAATSIEERFSVAVTARGLFVDIARAFRAAAPPAERILLLCGRDAAERIIGWDYPAQDPLERQLEEFELLVAPRHGAYHPPPRFSGRVAHLDMPPGWSEISSSAVREKISRGERWEDLVPCEIAERVRRLYS